MSRWPSDVEAQRAWVQSAAQEGDLERLALAHARVGPLEAFWVRQAPHSVAPSLLRCVARGHALPTLQQADGQSFEASASTFLSRLAALGVDLNARDGSEGQALLHDLARSSTPVLVRALLAAGADPKLRDAHGRTPLEWVMETQWSADEVGKRQALVDAGARLTRSPNSKEEPLLFGWLARPDVKAMLISTLTPCHHGDWTQPWGTHQESPVDRLKWWVQRSSGKRLEGVWAAWQALEAQHAQEALSGATGPAPSARSPGIRL